MPAPKRQQSSSMLYTLIGFVGLFIVATALAVVLYVKFEDQRRIAQESQRNLEELANSAEWRNRGQIIGTRQSRTTYLGTMIAYIDNLTSLIIGGPLEDTSAEVKSRDADAQAKDALNQAQIYIDTEVIDPNTTGLVDIVSKLRAKLDNTTNEKAALEKELSELRLRFEDAMVISNEKEQELAAEKEKYHQQAIEITQKYNELKSLMEQTSDERAQTLKAQLDETRANLRELNQELLRTQAELKMAQSRMRHALEQMRQTEPLPEREAAAFKPDGKIILVDDQTGVVHLNIGSDQHVYQGLTFSVYDGSAPIPKDGKAKAKIEVFAIAKNFSAARIVHSEKKNPIAVDDIIANLVWDIDKANLFVVAGEFDLDTNGIINADAIDRIRTMIEQWGGKVINTISVETDFVILGKPPRVPPEPSFEDLELDPLARDKYEAALDKLDSYKEIQNKAQALWIPVFKYERFLEFIGYEGQLTASGAF